jgi:hypothetical protein
MVVRDREKRLCVGAILVNIISSLTFNLLTTNVLCKVSKTCAAMPYRSVIVYFCCICVYFFVCSCTMDHVRTLVIRFLARKATTRSLRYNLADS